MDAPLKVMLLGEVYAKAGRQAVERFLPQLRRQLQPDIVIANGESAAGGYGLTASTARDLLGAGVDVITTGTRVFDNREMLAVLGPETYVPLTVTAGQPAAIGQRVLRPLNYPPGAPGRGWLTIQTARAAFAVVNLNGRTYFENMESPFNAIDRLLAENAPDAPIIVDFHAEATSEKVVLGGYLDGRVAAVLGTHNRLPTADARLLPGGTAHVSDVGMIGPEDGIGGLELEIALKPFLNHYSTRPRSSRIGVGVTWNSVLVTLDPGGRATAIERIDRFIEPGQTALS